MYRCLLAGHPSNKEDCVVSEEFRSIDLSNSLPTLRHPYKLVSAAGYPLYTNFTRDFKDVLDYIYVEESAFSIDHAAIFPTFDVLSESVALPSSSFPSDHLAVLVDLVMN